MEVEMESCSRDGCWFSGGDWKVRDGRYDQLGKLDNLVGGGMETV